MRLFIAIPFEPPVPQTFVGIQASLRAADVRGGYVPQQNLHLTLAFLGEVRDPRPVIAAIQSVPMPKTGLTYDRWELFGDTLVCIFRAGQTLRDYVRDLRQALDGAGISYDRKPFRPHVTLVRRASMPQDKAAVTECFSPLRDCAFPARRVCLMRTDFIDRRPKYTPLYQQTSV